MKTENELLHLALEATGEVTTFEAAFNQNGRVYTYLTTRELAKDLAKGSTVLVQRGAPDDVSGPRFSVATVKKVHREPKLQSDIVYSWAVRVLDDDVAKLDRLFDWCDQLAEMMTDAQRKKTRQAILAEFGELPSLPEAPGLVAIEAPDLFDEGDKEG